ncbi:unnamed protein product [Schistocephalus solidus]|uniref:Uncharacterized protein n=1 Tax=Schistocephalus solidus TaxID=70667 RepID=A0A183TPG6_SCHSO|nr:unnamed protein product [Schistocephalus solidus]
MHVHTSGCLALTNPGCPNRPITLRADSRVASPRSRTWNVATAAPNVPSSDCKLLPTHSPKFLHRIHYPPNWRINPVLIRDLDQIPGGLAEHFRGVLNGSSAISDAAIDRLPQVDTNNDLDLPPSLPETIWAVQQISSASCWMTARVTDNGTVSEAFAVTNGVKVTARVTDNGTVSEAFAVTNGVKRGCVLSLTLFSLMFSAMLIDAYRDEQSGIHIAYRTDGHLLNTRRM